MKQIIRLHIPAIPHTITNNEFSHCAFTCKVLRFCPMMISRGFEVYHYGVETSEAHATKHIDLLSKTEWEELRFISYKELHPELTDDEIKHKLSNNKNFVGDLGNVNTSLYKTFNTRLKEELQKHYRSTSTDIFCIPFGKAYVEALRGLNVVEVETGIGYPDSYASFRIVESYAQTHFVCGLEKINQPSNYWFVIPNYYNINEWIINNNPKRRIGYFGRICKIKGLDIFVEIAKRFPDVEFVMCGQGDETIYIKQSNNINYIEPIHGENRKYFLNDLTAIITPSLYIEPFCGVNVEAQLCGFPVISQDSGAFTETIENFKTGLLCHTLADYCFGVQMALDGKFDKQYIRDRAVQKYDMYNVALQYEYVFNSILDIYNGKNGWYSPDTYIDVLS